MPQNRENIDAIPIVAPFVIFTLIAGVVLALMFGARWEDVVRGMVLAETVSVAGLYVATIVNLLFMLRQARHEEVDQVVWQIALGRLCRITACLTLVLLGAVDLVSRFGHHRLAWYTPGLGLSDLLLLVAWLWLDLRRWKVLA